MLKLRSIGHDGLEAAAELLLKGFPSRSLAFWQDGLKRLLEYSRANDTGSIGTFLMADETPVGVLLTIARPGTPSGQRIVNLSSWYVEESHRWFAPRMLLAALADQKAVYTDLTPSKAAADLNLRLGFRTIDYDLHLLPLPWLAIVGRSEGKLHRLDKVPAGALSAELFHDLHYHQALGCIVTVIETGGRYHPVVFDTYKRKHVSIARVILAENQDLIVNNLAPLARMLILRGVPLLSLRVRDGSTLAHSRVWQRGLRYQIRGDWDDRSIDELYSERVLLKV